MHSKNQKAVSAVLPAVHKLQCERKKQTMSSGRVESLQRLAARVLNEQLAEKLERVVKEETSVFDEAVKQLEVKKESKIQGRRSELLCSAEAIHLQDMLGFCEQCNTFFDIDADPCCSIEGCMMHRECPCQFNTKFDDEFSFRDELSYTQVNIVTEQMCCGSWYWGEEDCWICKATFCKYHFFEHYEACRTHVSFRCGFRPRKYDSAFLPESYVRVPGHCGADVQDLNSAHFCEHSEYGEYGEYANGYERVPCGTLTCDACANHCNRCMGYCQRCWSSRCGEETSDDDDEG
jgi:hypothetical protein